MAVQYFDSAELIDEYLKRYQEDNGLTDGEMEERRRLGGIEGILPGFLLNDRSLYNRYVNFAVGMIRRVISDGVVLKKMRQVARHDADRLVYQEMRGAHRVFSGISGDEGGLLRIAGRFSGKELTALDARAYDAVCEFVNTINGAFASDLSGEDVFLEVIPPVSRPDGTTLSTNCNLYGLPAVVDGYDIELFFAFDCDIGIADMNT